MNNNQKSQAIRVATAGVASIGLIAFIISYNALQQVAQSHGVNGWLSYLWPLLIDLPILVFAFTSLVIQFITNRQSRFATSMIIAYSLATVAFNLIHAEMNIVNYLVAIVAPLSVIVTIEALRELVQIVAKSQAVEPAPLAEPVAMAEPQIEAEPQLQIETIATEAESQSSTAEPQESQSEPLPVATAEPQLQWPSYEFKAERRAIIASLKAQGLTVNEICSKLGISRDAVFRNNGSGN